MDLERVFADVFEILAKAAFVVVLYQFGKQAATIYPQRWRNYATLFGAAVVLALAFAGSYGTHSEDADPVRGGGRTVVDFVPTTEERAEQGLVALLVLVIPSFLGLAAGHERLPRAMPAAEIEDRTTAARGGADANGGPRTSAVNDAVPAGRSAGPRASASGGPTGGYQLLWDQHEQLVDPEGFARKYLNPDAPEM